MYNPSYAYAGQPPPFPVVRLHGLPFDCSEADVIDFFCGLDMLDILFVHKGGRFSGEAFCVSAYPLQVDFAIQRNRQNMGRRSADDGKDLVEHTGVLWMRGLPYSAGKDDVMDFFKDYKLSEDLVHIVLNSDGRPTGDAFVEFANAEDSKSAMGRDRMTLGRHYIELFPSTPKEMDDAIMRGRPII
ncbi:heterogeneous nuclear ribonucleoprotein F [Cocos nucifera]|uniref:Heterogeneous nuclear ribonucleoprotein F n=1 Tax=Cocos nucifera TaxID=13894 RepID=A0A8K0IWA0_COCNU|nr:heterogeneous nuclear ribonucleoprotein F [Cocos nucifera]